MRLVISGFLVARFKKSFRRKKVLDEILNGLNNTSATSPYENEVFRKIADRRRLCRNLYLTLRGCNNTYTIATLKFT